LFLNQGDGTFRTSTEAWSTDHWTASCLIADLNGDGFSDLYDVNYLQGDDVLTRLCPQPDGSPGVCIPRMFSGAPDRIWKNDANGGFHDSSQAVRVPVPGKGSGIVAANFDGDRRLEIFIANDHMHNFYFRKRDIRLAQVIPVFVEQCFST